MPEQLVGLLRRERVGQPTQFAMVSAAAAAGVLCITFGAAPPPFTSVVNLLDRVGCHVCHHLVASTASSRGICTSRQAGGTAWKLRRCSR